MFAEITASAGKNTPCSTGFPTLVRSHHKKVDLVLAGDLGQSVNIWPPHVHCLSQYAESPHAPAMFVVPGWRQKTRPRDTPK
ncbi:MAG: hypothetical protein Ct9H300mP1_13000 [Planctomycetaceae bacterium]|nr:MAG: hypothetical protein Ct9H300mP1_13000 [Planctomycetaceae bacterium]